MTLTFDYGSDIHIEFHPPIIWEKFKKKSPILIIAGDASNNSVNAATEMAHAKKFYDHVLYVDGNHDHYNRNAVNQNEAGLYRLSKDNGWVYLPREDFISDRTVFIGVNGWYNFDASDTISFDDQKNAWRRYIADSRLINFWGLWPEDMAEDHALILVDKVKKYEEDPNIDNIIVVTHVPPSRKFRIVRDDDYVWNLLNGTFYNSEMEKVHANHTKIKAWVCGHTHFSYDFVENNVRFLCNPKGYPGEDNATSWTPKTIKI